MGELHLEVIVDRMCASSRWRPTWVGRRCRIARRSPGPCERVEGRFVRQTGGRGQYGHVVLDGDAQRARRRHHLRGRHRGRHRAAGVHPGRSSRACARRWTAGVLAGFPVVDVARAPGGRLVPRGRLQRDGVQDGGLDGRAGGSRAAARSVLLEPVMEVEVIGAGGVRRRRDWRPERAPRPDRGHGAAGRRRQRRAGPRAAWPRCSATRPTCGP